MPVKKITNYDIYFGGYVRKNKRVKKVSLNDTSLILYAGDTRDLSFSIYPADGFYEEIEWTSSDPNVVSVDENGHIVALKTGKAIITIKINNATSRCVINVREVIHFEDPLVKSILVLNYDMDGDGEPETVVAEKEGSDGIEELEEVKEEAPETETDKNVEVDEDKEFMDSINKAVDKELAKNKK